ncbi:MAG: DUF4124 domain-containing protein [Burkholderiales bacterium]|nr:DUF4124 domain-containing protein [Burkholderiales bacterium]
MKIRHTSPALLASLTLAFAALVSTPAMAGMQWKWRDASGAIQYSDRPPPAGIPEASILARPSASRNITAPKQASEADAAASAAKPVAAKASESELDVKRRKADEEKAAKQKADEEKAAKVRADNCQQARNYQRTLNDGIRIARTNSKGEREVLDDKGRAEESKRTQEAIANNCK